MAYRERFSPEAEEDIQLIISDAPTPNDASRFFEELEQILSIIRSFPEAFKISYKNVRVVGFHKLPFKLIYKVVEPNTIIIISILGKKQQDHWKNQL